MSTLSFPELRIALLRLSEEPPFGLGDTQLARQFWPGENRLERGRLLRRALKVAILQLVPATPNKNDPQWRHYLICSREYELGQTRDEVCPQIAISQNTYTRVKTRALARINDMLPYIVERMGRERMVGD